MTLTTLAASGQNEPEPRAHRATTSYIGDSTRAEIAYARSLGKPVRFTHPEVDPDA